MKRFLLVVLGTLLLFLGLYLFMKDWALLDPDRIRDGLKRMQETEYGQLLVALMIIGFLGIDLLLPVPSSLLMALSGLFYGVVVGTLVCFTGSMLTATLGFGACRLGGHRIVEAITGKEELAKAGVWFERYGIMAIVISRPIPMLTEALSCLAGISDMRKRTFFTASAIGHFPVCLFYSYIGSKGNFDNPWQVVAASLLIPAIFLFAYKTWERKKTKTQTRDQEN